MKGPHSHHGDHRLLLQGRQRLPGDLSWRIRVFHAHTFQTRFLQLSVSHPNKVKHLSLFFHLKVSSNFTSLTQVHKQLQISIPCQAEHQL